MDPISLTRYGWFWPDTANVDDKKGVRGIAIERVTKIKRSNGTYHILSVSSVEHVSDNGNDYNKVHEIEIYFSPAGRIRVYKAKKELR